jgi:hypothetical protein
MDLPSANKWDLFGTNESDRTTLARNSSVPALASGSLHHFSVYLLRIVKCSYSY